MNMTVKSILDSKIATEDGAYPATELFYDPLDWSLRYALLDMGGWFRTDEVLITVQRLSRDGDGWSLHMNGDELNDAPVIDTIDAETTAWPPLVVGPFGNTFSPLALAASIERVTQNPDEPAPENDPVDDAGRDGTGRIARLERVSDLLGREGFDNSGSRGKIADLGLSDDLKIVRVILDNGETVDIRRLRRIAEQGHALFD